MTISNASATGSVENALPRRRAILFIVFLGVVSLFGDMTYEGARSITGPYLGLLGVTATTIGIVAGFGELMGYGARRVSGYLGDRTGRYWAVTIAGYLLNLFAVPLLALAGAWQLAVVLIIAERMGRGIRSPVRDAMLSHAASRTGLGWGFGLHQALDQLGAVAGPLVVSGVLFVGSGYQAAFGWLLIPAVLSIAVLLAARYLFPRPHDFELAPPPLEGEGLAPIFWVYIVAVAFIASAAAAPLVFLGNLPLAIIGMACWGLGTGAQDSVMRATISRLAPQQRRATAFGIMNAVYGVAWFAGSVLLGVLYDLSLVAVVLTSALLQAAALPIFVRLAAREA